MQKIVLSLILVLIVQSISIAQGIPNLGQTDRWMKGALAALERKDYETANSIFRNLIDSGLPLPEEMPYYFSETLYHLGQYDNSQNFLNKYLEITGFNGQNYKGAVELKEKLSGPIAEIRACSLCDLKGYRFGTCFTCEGKKQIEQSCSYCKSKGVVGCSRCAATGMIKKTNVFNIVEFYECERCSGKGRLTCPTCQGSGKEVSDCKTCQGSGKLTSDLICDHKEHVHDAKPAN
ncbi:outer membrane protein assembly factor BamD [Algoriphagus taiwanensis]|uniref:Molecular chaperone DnaJ n=1 Tax=Algoriphagus taiwanensis TaxID=1445656 RepID=A0ABQ6PYF7_9BACT|nr:hypothetical protein Ataiwa_12360 [Algoriphagus taiwanensis]